MPPLRMVAISPRAVAGIIRQRPALKLVATRSDGIASAQWRALSSSALAEEPPADVEDVKSKVERAWSSSAGGWGEALFRSEISDLHRVHRFASQLCVNVAAKRCQHQVGPSKYCLSRATHGKKGHGATACSEHKAPGMVDLKKTPQPSILDVGASSGEPSLTIAKDLPHARIYCTDISPAVVEAMKARVGQAGASNVICDVADGEDLRQFGNESMDAVMCTFALMFMPNWQKALKEFHRVLKPEGVVLASVWDRVEATPFVQAQDLVLARISPGFKPLVHPCSLSGPEDSPGGTVEKAMAAAGLGNIQRAAMSVSMAFPDEDSAWDALLALPFKASVLASSKQSGKGGEQALSEAKKAYGDVIRQNGWLQEDGSVALNPNNALIFIGRKAA